MKRIICLFVCLFAGMANAQVIDFEDLTTRNNFTDLAIVDSYQGFEWGYGNTAGVAGRTFTNAREGWASHTTTNTASGPMPSGLSGTSAAWNWNGPMSLWIDFKTATDFASGLFSVLGTTYSGNASTVQLFGYDAADNLIGSSSILALDNTFQSLSANFIGINYLEIRANADGKWFSIDDLNLSTCSSNCGPNAIPEPVSIALLGLGLAGIGFSRKRVAKI